MTTGGDVKAILDTVSALTETYRQAHVPDGAVFPYASFLDPVSQVPALSGDARTLAFRRLLQVDLWQTREGESDALLDAVVLAIDGADAATGFRLRVENVVLVPGPEEDEGIIHHAITVALSRVR